MLQIKHLYFRADQYPSFLFSQQSNNLIFSLFNAILAQLVEQLFRK